MQEALNLEYLLLFETHMQTLLHACNIYVKRPLTKYSLYKLLFHRKKPYWAMVWGLWCFSYKTSHKLTKSGLSTCSGFVCIYKERPNKIEISYLELKIGVYERTSEVWFEHTFIMTLTYWPLSCGFVCRVRSNYKETRCLELKKGILIVAQS